MSQKLPSVSAKIGDSQPHQWGSAPEKGEPFIDKFGEGHYEGELVGKLRHGHGRMVYSIGSPNFAHYTGAVYEGDYNRNRMHGVGTIEFTTDEKYEGSFENDLYHGTGRLQLANGECYEGSFVEGIKMGTGIYTWTNGDIYNGQWRKGKRNGEGTMVFGNGRESKYGQWSGDVCYWEHKFKRKPAHHSF